MLLYLLSCFSSCCCICLSFRLSTLIIGFVEPAVAAVWFTGDCWCKEEEEEEEEFVAVTVAASLEKLIVCFVPLSVNTTNRNCDWRRYPPTRLTATTVTMPRNIDFFGCRCFCFGGADADDDNGSDVPLDVDTVELPVGDVAALLSLLLSIFQNDCEKLVDKKSRQKNRPFISLALASQSKPWPKNLSYVTLFSWLGKMSLRWFSLYWCH